MIHNPTFMRESPEVNWWIRDPLSVREADEAQSWCSGLVVTGPYVGAEASRNKSYVKVWYEGVLGRNEALAKSWRGDYFSMQRAWPTYASPRWYARHDPHSPDYWSLVQALSTGASLPLTVVRPAHQRAVYLENHSKRWTWRKGGLDVIKVVTAMVRSRIRFDIGHPWSDYREFYTLACRFCTDEFWGTRYSPHLPAAKPGSRNTQIIAVSAANPNPHKRFTPAQTVDYLLSARQQNENVTIFPNRNLADPKESLADVARQIGEEWAKVAVAPTLSGVDPMYDADAIEPMQEAAEPPAAAGTGIEVPPEERSVVIA